jgi:methylphosphotriester-DNA--protein-cysteine methyltransferase
LIEATFQDVLEWCEIVTGLEFPSLLFGRILRPPPPDAIRLLNLHAEAGRLFGADPETRSHPEVVRGLEQNMIHALVTCLGAAPIQEDTPAQRRRSDVMVRFEAAITSRSDRQIPGLAEICGEIGVSGRRLDTYSRQFFGMGSRRYLLLRRLSVLRDALRAGQILTDDLDAVARDYGFVDLRRLDAVYLSVFGEGPQATIDAKPSLVQR